MYLIDTHALLWYEFDQPKLSDPARAVFDNAQPGTLILHPIVLAEVSCVLCKQGHGHLFQQYMRFLEISPLYTLDDIRWADFAELEQIPEIPEMHNRLLAVAAKRLNLPVVTTDLTIRACKQVRCIW